jgi:hypothetical protein
MTRLDGWPERLSAVIEDARRTPFVWGETDCCQFVGRCVAAMTGTNPAAAWRGRARTARGASRIIRRLGGMRAAWRAVLGPETPLPLAGRGDVVIVPGRTDDAVGIVDLSGVHAITVAEVSADARTLRVHPLSAALVAWRI